VSKLTFFSTSNPAAGYGVALRATPSYQNLTTTSLRVLTGFPDADPSVDAGFGRLAPVLVISSGK